MTAPAAAPVRLRLPDSPQGEAISFSADNRNLVVASEGLPSDVTVVPLAAETVAAMTSQASGPVPSMSDLTRSGLPPITNGLIAASVATVVVWIGGKLSRRRPDRRPAGIPSRTATPRPQPAQSRRSTATTLPMIVASSPGIGSNAGFCGTSHRCPSRLR